jgi:hypothetical protein
MAVERFLYRLSKSAHSERFVLKGAMPKSLGVEAPSGLGAVIYKISEFVLPPAIAAATEQPFNKQWKGQNQWQPGGSHPLI